MLAAMNGHTAAVRLLLDCGSDINAQIETNRNTALTLACFQGIHIHLFANYVYMQVKWTRGPCVADE